MLLLCIHCQSEKDESSFNLALKRRRSLCHSCRAAANHAGYMRHRTKKLAASKRYFKTYKRHSPPQRRTPKSKEAVAAYNQAYYRKNAQIHMLKKRAYNKIHPEVGVLVYHRRRTRLAGAQRNTLSVAQWREILQVFDYRCAYCPPTCVECENKTHSLQREHITPVIEQGDTHIWNIVPACISCNSKKGTKKPHVPVQPLLITIAQDIQRKPHLNL